MRRIPWQKWKQKCCLFKYEIRLSLSAFACILRVNFASNFYVSQFCALFVSFYSRLIRSDGIVALSCCVCICIWMLCANMILFVFYQLNGWKATPNLKTQSHCQKCHFECNNREGPMILTMLVSIVIHFFISLYACKYAYACMRVCVMCTKSAPNSFFILTLTQPTTAVFSYKFYNTFAFQMICHHILLTLTHIRMFSGYISVDRHIYVVFFYSNNF